MASSSDTKDYKDHDKSHVDPETTDSDSASHHSLLKEERSDYFGISTLSPDFQEEL